MRPVLTYACAALFAFTGVWHFAQPIFFLALMPTWVPWPEVTHLVAAVFEIAGAIGLCIPRLRRAASIGLCVLLVAVFPANVYAAMSGMPLLSDPPPVWSLWARLPLQAVLLWWVWWVGHPARDSREVVASTPAG